MSDENYNKMKSENENLASSQTVIIGSWVAVSERLPEIPKDAPSFAQYVKVIACWGDRNGLLPKNSKRERSLQV